MWPDSASSWRYIGHVVAVHVAPVPILPQFHTVRFLICTTHPSCSLTFRPRARTHARTHAVLKITAKEDRCIVHFMHPDFRTCEVMAGHLRLLARQHFRTRFYFFNADKGRWVSSKLKVRTLPAVLMFIGGVCKDRIEGFEELGNNEGFSTKTLEARLAKSGVISLGSENAAAAGSSRIFGFAKKKKEDGDDSDDD
jgi:hypothetical protein